jgi:hypothetical protein
MTAALFAGLMGDASARRLDPALPTGADQVGQAPDLAESA